MSFGLSGTVLPVHPQPKPDEIFSSWYCRIAQENEIKLHTLEVQLWGREKQIWTRDIDRSIDEQTLTRVASVSGTGIDHARDTCLRSYEGKLFNKLLVTGNSNWILPAGVFHRKRRRRGMQFCPLCLATDEIPYYRKTWRLALFTFCDVHDVMLHDCCPQCQSPVMFHRQELGNRWANKIESLSLCTACGFDLKRAPVCQASTIEIGAWLALKSQLFYLDNGWTFTPGMTFLYSHLYFDVLRNLIRKLLSNWTTGRLLQHAQEIFYVPISLNLHHDEPFEFYGVNERHYLVQIATWYLLDWPKRFLEISKTLRVRYSELMREFDPIPFWFIDSVAQLEIKPIGPSDGEKGAMRQILQRDYDQVRRKVLRNAIWHRIGKNSINKYFDFSFDSIAQ